MKGQLRLDLMDDVVRARSSCPYNLQKTFANRMDDSRIASTMAESKIWDMDSHFRGNDKLIFLMMR